MKIIRYIPITPVVALAALILIIVSDANTVKASPKTPVPVGVIEGEWFVLPSTAAALGDHFIMFNVTNPSAFIPHELIVIRLKHGLMYNQLPISTNPASEYFGRVDEDALGNQILGEIEEEELPPGGSASLTLGMPPGDYALICNLPGHYLLGMRAQFNTTGH